MTTNDIKFIIKQLYWVTPRDRDILIAHNQGVSLGDLAKQYELTKQAISNICTRKVEWILDQYETKV